MKLLETCIWVEKDEGAYWETGCGTTFCFLNDGPRESGFLYCPYCRGILIPYYLPKESELPVEDDDEDELI